MLLSVHCDSGDWVKRAKDILAQTGAQDIASAGEKTGDFANADKPMPRVRTAGGNTVVTDEELYGEPIARESVTREVIREPIAREPIVREPIIRPRTGSDLDEV